MKQLPLKLQDKPFTVEQLRKAGLSFYELKLLIVAGTVEQVARGIYRPAGIDINEEEQFRIATLRVGRPSAICLLSALSFHHLTDSIPKETWIMVPRNKNTADRKTKVFRARTPHWKIGIEAHDGYSVTTVERTIVNCLAYRSRLGTERGIKALREAVSSKRTTLGKVMDMAIKLGVGHRVLPYIEALS